MSSNASAVPTIIFPFPFSSTRKTLRSLTRISDRTVELSSPAALPGTTASTSATTFTPGEEAERGGSMRITMRSSVPLYMTRRILAARKACFMSVTTPIFASFPAIIQAPTSAGERSPRQATSFGSSSATDTGPPFSRILPSGNTCIRAVFSDVSITFSISRLQPRPESSARKRYHLPKESMEALLKPASKHSKFRPAGFTTRLSQRISVSTSFKAGSGVPSRKRACTLPANIIVRTSDG